jgi:hypothetical protein
MRILIQMIDQVTGEIQPVTPVTGTRSEYTQGGFIPENYYHYRKMNRAYLNFPKDIDPKLAAGQVAQVVFCDPILAKDGTVIRKGLNIRFTPIKD